MEESENNSSGPEQIELETLHHLNQIKLITNKNWESELYQSSLSRAALKRKQQPFQDKEL